MVAVLEKTRSLTELVGPVRQGMQGPGHCCVEAPCLFDRGQHGQLRRHRTILSPDSPQWHRFPELARYVCWLEALLGEALPQECLGLASLEHRHERAGLVDEAVDRLHADGSYVRAVYTLYGRPTLYRDGTNERPVPDGQTLLMTAMSRARALRIPCTLHRRPGPGPARALIVCSFEPRAQLPDLPCLYWDIVLAGSSSDGPARPCADRTQISRKAR